MMFLHLDQCTKFDVSFLVFFLFLVVLCLLIAIARNVQPKYLPFAGRLARFPDAWLLPLFPLLVRGCWHLYINCIRNGSVSTNKADFVYARRRLYLYLILIQVRGWILYLAFDELEELFVVVPETPCWYEQYLYPHYNQCQGRMLDFSDHVVLYFAQILPIALMETIHSFSVPYWTEVSRRKGGLHGHDISGLVVPTVLLLCLANLYIVTFLGAYKTAAYFHTGPEVFMGFLVSLVIQIPLFILQCTSHCQKWRDYLFGMYGQ